MAHTVIHISEAEAERDLRSVLERVRDGAEVVIEGKGGSPRIVIRTEPERRSRLLSEAIALAEAHGSTVTLDEKFSRDLEAVINSHREPLNPPTWD